ncbi:MAG: tetratricopeptide repeat protein [Gemmatimonadaceae bacterium]
MIAEKIAEQVELAKRRPSSLIVLGEGSVLGPKSGSELVMDQGQNDATRFAAIDDQMAGTEAQNLLADGAAVFGKRALRFPNSPEAWVQSGFASLASGDHASAETSFNQALALSPKHRSARLGLVRVMQQTRRAEKALPLLESLRTEYPNDLELLVAGAVVLLDLSRVEDAVALLDREVPTTPQTAGFLAARGTLKVFRAEYREGISDLRKAVRMKPEFINARNVLGIAEFKLGRWDSAAQRFREAMRLGPLHQESFENLLRIYLFEKRFSEIRQLVAARYKVATAPPHTARIAGRASLEEERWNEAREWLEAAASKTENDAVRAGLLNDAGVAYSRMSMGDRAIQKFEQAFMRYPAPLYALNKARQLLSAGRPEKVIEWFASIPVMEGENGAEAGKLLVKAFVADHQYERAVELGLPLLADEHADADLYGTMSAAFSDGIGDLKQAVSVAAEGRERFPDDPMLANNLAYAFLLAGDRESARRLLSEVVEDPNENVALTATRGLLALWEGRIQEGTKLYDLALSKAMTDSVRERVRVKRDLEVGRALLRLGQSTDLALTLLRRAASGSASAYPYSDHAKAEMKRIAPGKPRGESPEPR